MFGGAVLGFAAAAVIFILIIALAIAYFGFFPGLSDLMGTNKPRDLGVKYTNSDYNNALAKIPGFQLVDGDAWCLTCPYVSSGSVPVDTEITQEEFTANLNHPAKDVFKDAQVKFNADGTIETSALLDVPQLQAPVYAKGRLDKVSSGSVTFKLESLEVGRLGVGGDQLVQAQDALNTVTQDFFAKNPGLSVDTLQVEDGKVKFKGTYPQQMQGIPGSVPAQFQ